MANTTLFSSKNKNVNKFGNYFPTTFFCFSFTHLELIIYKENNLYYLLNLVHLLFFEILVNNELHFLEQFLFVYHLFYYCYFLLFSLYCFGFYYLLTFQLDYIKHKQHVFLIYELHR